MAAVDLASAKAPAAGGFRDVLVPQDETDAAMHALVYADMLCSAFGAHLTGLMFGLVPFYPMSLAAAKVPEAWIHAQRQASEEAEQSEKRLKAVYGKLTAHNELRRVDAFEQEVGDICARHARSADVTVIGWSPDGGADMERAFFESCLFDSGRPVLVVPARYAFRSIPQRAVVAWNGSREATRALREALPLLRQTRLTRFVTVDAEDNAFSDAVDPCASIARHMGRHEIPIETKRAHSRGRDVATVLAEEADQFGASILVLGGYGHMRANEWIYGGTTRASLALAHMPMFFAN
jgi:nucleotide-binding universal stress UspA family protein